MDDYTLTDEETKALTEQAEELEELEVLEEEAKKIESRKKDKPIPKAILIATLAALVALPVGWKMGYNQKTKQLEKEIQAIYTKAEKTAQEIYGNAIENASLGTRRISNLQGANGLLDKLTSERIISNPGIIRRDNDGLVYAVFNTDLDTIKKIIANPNEHNLYSDSRERLYSTLKDSLADNNGQYIIEFNGEQEISNVYESSTGLPVGY